MKRQAIGFNIQTVSVVGAFPHNGVWSRGEGFFVFHSKVISCPRDIYWDRVKDFVPFIASLYSFRMIAFGAVVRNAFPVTAC